MAAKEHSVPRKTLATHSKNLVVVPSCCGAVASAGTGNLVKVEGRMDSTQYQQILGNNVEESVTNFARTTDLYLVSSGVRICNLPVNSPTL